MSAPPLDAVGLTLREFVARSGALRAVALLDRGEGAAPVVVDCDGSGAIEVEGAAGGGGATAPERAPSRWGRRGRCASWRPSPAPNRWRSSTCTPCPQWTS